MPKKGPVKSKSGNKPGSKQKPTDKKSSYLSLPNLHSKDKEGLDSIPKILQYIFNKRVQNAFLHFLGLMSNSYTRHLIEFYKGNTEPEDWRQFWKNYLDSKGDEDPSLMHYKILNFLFRFDLNNPQTMREIMMEHPLIFRVDPDQWVDQLGSAVDLMFVLCDYPKDPSVREEVFVYRGQWDYSFYDGKEPGEVFEQKGFFSTTLNRDTALSFSNRSHERKIIRIRIPPGFPVPVINDRLTRFSVYERGNESEVLCPPSSTFRFEGIHEEDGIDYIDLELVSF
jgi:hypothetical protein